MNNEFDKNLDAIINDSKDIRRFLKLTPFTNDPALKFQGKLTTDYFFKHFFSSSETADKAKTGFDLDINNSCQIILITGYKGCGKTTYIRYITLDKRIKNINFDRYLSTTEPIKSQLVSELYDDICKDWDKERLTLKTMLEIFYEPSNRKFIDRKIDPSRLIISFLEKCKQLHEICQQNKDNEIDYFDEIKNALNYLDINQILLMMLFWDISYKIAYDKKKNCYIIFDNLDAIYDAKELQKLMLEFVVFYNNSPYVVGNITHHKLKSQYNAFQDYIFIFVMRETTKSTLTEHFNDRIFGDYHYCDVSVLFDKKDFVSKRYEYLLKNPNLTNKSLENMVGKVNQLLDDLYIQENVFPLFNNDYRTIIDVLTEITKKLNDKDELERCCDLLKSKYVFIRFGARGILFKNIFDLFFDENCLSALQSTEVSVDGTRNSAINISRIVLLFLLNYAKENRTKQYLNDKPGISLLTVFKDLEPICDLSMVISSLWTMFEFREKQYWNHLITFDFLSISSYEQLKNELDKYNDGNKNHNDYPLIRISCAGRVYLHTLLSHYEFEVARVFGKSGKPLFLSTCETTDGVYAFEQIIEGVYKKVKDCCQKLKIFYETIFVEELEYSDEEFLGSRFAFHKFDDSEYKVKSMFHGERIIHSHISYLDAFRKYAIMQETNKHKKPIINKKILDFIKKYIKLFDPQSVGQHSSEQTITLIQNYNKCIKFIENKNYTVFKKSVDNQTGQKLPEEVN